MKLVRFFLLTALLVALAACSGPESPEALPSAELSTTAIVTPNADGKLSGKAGDVYYESFTLDRGGFPSVTTYDPDPERTVVGDADLYVKVGGWPTLDDYDCLSNHDYDHGGEFCGYDTSVRKGETVYVMVYGYTDFSGVSSPELSVTGGCKGCSAEKPPRQKPTPTIVPVPPTWTPPTQGTVRFYASGKAVIDVAGLRCTALADGTHKPCDIAGEVGETIKATVSDGDWTSCAGVLSGKTCSYVVRESNVGTNRNVGVATSPEPSTPQTGTLRFYTSGKAVINAAGVRCASNAQGNRRPCEVSGKVGTTITATVSNGKWVQCAGVQSGNTCSYKVRESNVGTSRNVGLVE